MSFHEIGPDFKPLLLQLKDDDLTAFDEIFNRFADPIHSYVQSCLGPNDADDVLQEVFFRLWQKRHSIDIHTSFRNYLYTIVQHCISDHLRASKRKRYTSTDQLPDLSSSQPQPDEQYHYKQVYNMWKGATEQLPGKMRRIYTMKNEEQLSVGEIAKTLQLSEQTVKNQLHHAGQRMIKFLRNVHLFFF